MGGGPLVEEQVFTGHGWWHRLRAVVVEPEGVRFVWRWRHDALLTWDEITRLSWRDGRELVLHTRRRPWVVGPHIARLPELAAAVRGACHEQGSTEPVRRNGEDLRRRLADFDVLEAFDPAPVRPVGLKDLSESQRTRIGGAALAAGIFCAANASSVTPVFVLAAVAGTPLAVLLACLTLNWLHSWRPGIGVRWRVAATAEALEVGGGTTQRRLPWNRIRSFSVSAKGLTVYPAAGRACHIPALDGFLPMIEAARRAMPTGDDETPVPATALSRIEADRPAATERGISLADQTPQ